MALMVKYGPPRGMWPEFKLDFPEAEKWPEKLNVTQFLIDKNIIEGRGDKTAILHGSQRITFNELYEMVCSFSRALKSLGVEYGDRVILRLPNIPEFVICHLAAQRIGAVSVPIFPWYRAREIAYVANDCEAKVFVTLSGLIKDVQEIQSELRTVKHLIVVDNEKDGVDEKYLSFSGLMERFRGKSESEAVRLHQDEMALLLYTSGTTGRPKGCIHAHREYLAVAECYFGKVVLLSDKDICGGPSSLAFAFGHGSLLALYFGGAVSLYGNRKFEPNLMFRLIEEHGITVLLAVPSAYRAMVTCRDEARHYDFSSLRVCISAGEHLPASLYEEVKGLFGCEVLNGLGTTELMHIFISNRIGAVKPGSLGLPVPSYEVKVLDDAGRELYSNQIGHLAVKGPTGIRYWRRDDEQAKYVKHGFNYTGDLAYIDEDGFFWFVGRGDDIIKTAGYRVSPQEVEEILAKHSAISEVAVIGKPHPELGQIVKAFVVLKPGFKPSAELERDIISFVKASMAPYKAPREIKFIDELPKTPTGKIRRKELAVMEKQGDMQ